MNNGLVHWRSLSRDNVLTIYGLTDALRIADPSDTRHVFAWLISETHDDKGNIVLYDYKAEDATGVDQSLLSERNRGPLDDAGRQVNRYIKSIRYTNQTPLLGADGQRNRFTGNIETSDADWLFQAVFDYLDGTQYQWRDLHGEGIPGLLSEQGGAWYYKRNLSPVSEKTVEFAGIETVCSRPNRNHGTTPVQWLDLTGDGAADLVFLDGSSPGYHTRADSSQQWAPFRTFRSHLHRDTRDPNLRFIDLNGDGFVDALITEEYALVWHPSLAEDGFGPARRVPHALDEESGPRLVFADSAQSIHIADMSGDGLGDLVRIRNNEICYWPEYKKFKPRITTKPPHKKDLQPEYFTSDTATKYLPTDCLTHRP